MEYRDFVIEATRLRLEKLADGRWMRILDVRALRSDAFGDTPGQWYTTSCDALELKTRLAELAEWKLDRAALFDLGRMLAGLIMPVGDGVSGVRELFVRSLDEVGTDGFMRLRLVLSPELAGLPWEYLYLDRTGGSENSMLGFIGLDQRIAIVRSEPMATRNVLTPIDGDIQVLAALASPEDQEPLDLKMEADVIKSAFGKQPGLKLDLMQDAAFEFLDSRLDGKHIFHFAGHGLFKQRPGAQPGTVAGDGILAFEDRLVDADQLGIELRGHGIQLAVLAGCETGKRAGPYDLGSCAVGLARAQIPAVVANQFAIHDSSAIAFSRGFYTALDGGMPLERAMQAGRTAVYKANPNDRDWGVPVLYMRAASGQLFSGASDVKVRAAARRSVETNVAVDLMEVGKGSFVTGAKLLKALPGKLRVNVNIAGDVEGTVTGARISRPGGDADIGVKANRVGSGGEVTGLVFGGDDSPPPRAPAGRATAASPDDEPPHPPVFRGGAGSRSAPSSPAPNVESQVAVHEVRGGEVIGTQVNYREKKIIQGLGGIAAEAVNIQSVNIMNGGPAADPDSGLTEESLRLYVATPSKVVVNEVFEIAVQVTQPESPALPPEQGLENVNMAKGIILRREASEAVRYKIVPSGDGFEFTPSYVTLKMNPGKDSPPIYLQGISRKPGPRKLLVTAYQDDDTFAAQTRITLQVEITA